MFQLRPVLRLASQQNWSKQLRLFKSITGTERNDAARMLKVTWDNGIVSRFPYVWLRDNCPAAHSYNLTEHCKSRKLLFKDLDIKVVPDKVQSSPEGVQIVWPGEKDAFYSSQWLADRNIDNPEIRKRRPEIYLETEKQAWDANIIQKVFRSFDWTDMLNDERTLLDALTYLNTWGLLLVDAIPCQRNEELKLGKELGYIKTTHYGETFEVWAEPAPSNLAYTSLELGPHTDLPYFDEMPEIQALHCIQSAGEGQGGENSFVDVFNVSEQIKAACPEHYKLLCDVDVEYVDDILEKGKTYQQIARHPIFNFDRNGNFKFGAFNNQVRSWFYPLEPENVKEFYDALATFRDYYSKEENVINLKLKSGQMIVFDNLRIMHARKAYEIDDTTRRHLQGIYYTWDSVRSKIRSLRRKLNTGPQHVTV